LKRAKQEANAANGEGGGYIKEGTDNGNAAKGGMSFATTESVTVSGSRAIDLGKSYEAGVQGMYNGAPYNYKTVVDGQRVNGIADTVTSVAGKQTAVEAKFVEDWATSLRNPSSPVGNKPWAISEQQAMVNQAAKYSSGFEGGVIYHTNSTELAAYYSQAFKDAGITNFKFVITPAVK
jgi:filamentous hemagglutinin